ncbi:hypothetical protein AR687_14820 [Flavobacteriaceae bacterium CRH]|nr:hypothetical protein AR687_14820 [Flavobacteriaceae bacterium CRH]
MKKLILLFFYSALLISCKNENTNAKDTITSSSAKTEPTDESIKKEKENINHLFVANGGSVLYMKNGERRSQARFDTDGDFVEELLKVAGKDGNYKDFDDYLIENNDTLQFFDEFGIIKPDWVILKGNEISNRQQIISFTTPKNPTTQDIQSIQSTQLIFFTPEPREFEDENSEEADAYFTAMDDWGWYAHELREYLEKKGIKESSGTPKRYLQFKIENNKTILIDTKSKINNCSPDALLYKKGKTPMILHLIVSDNNPDEIKKYLK